MKRLIALPATLLAATLVFAACSGSEASVQPGDTSIATLPSSTMTSDPSTTATSDPSTTATSDPTTTASTLPATTKAPTTTVKRTPVTTVKPAPTTTVKPTTVSGTPEQLALKAATSLGNAVDVAREQGDRAPIYRTIWNQYAAAGMKITIPTAMRAADNPTGLPSFSAAYQISGNGKTFCLLWVGGSSYETQPGACG